MANWNEFCNNVSRTANKAAVKAGELGDTVKLKYKLHQAKGELSELYEKLGKLTFDQLHFGHDHAAEVSELLPRIERTRDKIRRLAAAVAKEDNAVYCANCGTKLEPDMTYCPGCGTKQAKSEKAEKAETVSAAADPEAEPSAEAAEPADAAAETAAPTEE